MEQSAASDMLRDVATALARGPAIVASIPKVYSFYLAYRAQKGLQGIDPEGIIASVADIETVGDCRHAIKVTDMNGQKYLITIEVL